MAIGPVQLLVLGFRDPDIHEEMINQLERLRRSDTVRVLDALTVYKDIHGSIRTKQPQGLPPDPGCPLGGTVAALLGLGPGTTHLRPAVDGPGAGTAAASSILADDETWDVLADIPEDSAAILILIEHHWAVPLRRLLARCGGFRIGDAFVSPVDLIDIGLVTAEEALELDRFERVMMPD